MRHQARSDSDDIVTEFISFLSGSRQRRGLPNSRNSALLTLVNHEASPVLPLRRIPYLRRIEARKPNFLPHRTFGFARLLKD